MCKLWCATVPFVRVRVKYVLHTRAHARYIIIHRGGTCSGDPTPPPFFVKEGRTCMTAYAKQKAVKT